MTVESATYISGLNASYPPGSDSISEGDDHLRLIKSVLKSTLPNADEAINGIHTGTTAPTPTSAGQLWFDTSGTGELKVRNKADSAFASVDTSSVVVPAGIITMWSGASSAIPTGWTLCDGSASTPDLRDRFVVGATSTYAVDATGGSTTSGTHTLLTAEMPAHTHSFTGRGFTANNGTGVSNDYGDFAAGTTTVSSAGGGGAHSHAATLPPYYALCYIMKT